MSRDRVPGVLDLKAQFAVAQILAEITVELFGWLAVLDNLTLKVCDLLGYTLYLTIGFSGSGFRGRNGIRQTLELVESGRDGVGLKSLSRRADPCLKIVTCLVVLLDDIVKVPDGFVVDIRGTDC